MKVSEFEAKLGTVSDAKLRQMLSSGREHGPQVAVDLILAEYRRRGMEDMDAPESGDAPASPQAGAYHEVRSESMATSAYPKEVAGAFGADGPLDPPSDPSMPALSPEWLSEETKSGMPMALKALLLIAVVGAILALAWKFTR
jgi:hypothetical protein